MMIDCLICTVKQSWEWVIIIVQTKVLLYFVNFVNNFTVSYTKYIINKYN